LLITQRELGSPNVGGFWGFGEEGSMSIVEPNIVQSGLVQRVKALLLKPSETWDVIDAEPATTSSLYRGYACILAAIPPVATLIGGVVFGHGGFGIRVHTGIVSGIVGAVVTYGLSLLTCYVLALIIDALAPSFDGQKNKIQALKVAIYSNTAAWVAGIFGIFGSLLLTFVGGLLGLYSLYLLYLGLPKLMKAPQEKALGYTAVSVIVAVVLFWIITMVAGAVAGIGAFAGVGALSHASNGSTVTGTMKLPGGSSVDLAKLQAASQQMEAASKQMQAGAEGKGAVQATNPDLLKAYLPGGVSGYARTDVSTGSGGVGGVASSSAEGTYSKGDANFKLTVTDMGTMAGMAAMAGAFNVQSSSEHEGRYEKVGKVDGRMTTESYDKGSKHGEYGVMVGDRFMVQAEGEGVDMSDLKAAVGSVNTGRLEALAKAG
jgi:hypothetical protein